MTRISEERQNSRLRVSQLEVALLQTIDDFGQEHPDLTVNDALMALTRVQTNQIEYVFKKENP